MVGVLVPGQGEGLLAPAQPPEPALGGRTWQTPPHYNTKSAAGYLVLPPTEGLNNKILSYLALKVFTNIHFIIIV